MTARGTLFKASRLSGHPAQAPAVFRLDGGYDMAQAARRLNAFVSDTVRALEAIAAALDDVAETLDSIEERLDALE